MRRIVNLTYVRTPMLQLNFENAAWKKKKHFVIEPETVADAIVKQLHSGMGGQIVLPGRYLFATTIGAWPAWMQESLRNMMGKESAWLGDKGKAKNEPDYVGFGK
jgi:all-trans-retinol dehydrogenase (NAD+)